jgi:HSP20 family protein
MRRGRDDDPFDDLFREIERLMESMIGGDADGGFDAAATTDTHVGVHEYEDRVVVIADLPGVSKGDVDVKCNGNVLSIRASGTTTSYAEQVPLPVAVDETSARASFNNGVLEVRLEGVDDSADIDVE